MPLNAQPVAANSTSQRAALRLLTAMISGCIVLPLLLFTGVARTSWQDVHRSADERLGHALDVLHEHTLEVFKTAELMLDNMSALTASMSDAQIAADAPRLHAIFQDMARSAGDHVAVWVASRNGTPLVTDLMQPPPEISLAGNEYFRVQEENAAAGTYLGEVVRSPLGQAPLFTLSRRRQPGSEFTGIVGVALQTAELERFYGNLNDLGDYFALVRADGAFLARFPPIDDREQRAAGVGPAAVVNENPERGIYTARSTVDGRERRVGYRKLGGYPAFIFAGVETEAIRAEWLRRVGSLLLFGLPASALLIAALLFALSRTRRLYDEERRREAVELGLRRAQGLEAIGQLTGGVAHDFNNLLMVVLGTVERLRAQPRSERDMRGLEAIEAAARRGERLTRQLLSFSRRQVLAPQPIDISRCIPEMAEMLKRSLRGDIRLAFSMADAPTVAVIDLAEFELALLNLAVNARDAMPQGGSLRIAVRRLELQGLPDGLSGAFVEVAVTDTGTGISPDVLAKAFDPFFTTKEQGRGTGLGLSQVYGFARQCGGTATIESVPDAGTTVHLYLPSTTAAPAPAVATAPRRSVVPTGQRILVVEDNVAVAEVTRGYLERLGYSAAVAADAMDALRQLAAAPVDAVLTDIVMPGHMNGLDLARDLRRRYPKLPVLLATGYSGSAKQAIEDGFHLLQKPYDMDRLGTALHAALAREPSRPDAVPDPSPVA